MPVVQFNPRRLKRNNSQLHFLLITRFVSAPTTHHGESPMMYSSRRCVTLRVRAVELSSCRAVELRLKQDTGHPYDWEWAAVKFVQNADGQYIRTGIWLEQDGNHPYTAWSSIPSTFDGYAPSSRPFTNLPN